MFTLAHGVVKHEPIEQEDYWEEDCEFKGVEEHGYLAYVTFWVPKSGITNYKSIAGRKQSRTT